MAIKEVNKDKVDKLGIIHHIMREKEFLSELKDNPHVIELLATAQDDTNLYFIFEVSPNGTLYQLCTQRGKLSMDVCRGYAAQIASLLDCLQSKQISHRDMKPHNLMLDERMNLKLIDFGDAKKMDEAEDKEEEKPT